MAGRRTSLASLAGAKVEDVPGRSDAVLLSLPLDRLHCTRFNPRRNFGTEEDLRDFGEKLKREQLQPAVVVSRAGYLKLWPEEADNVGTCPYVIANGERRYRASKLVGRPVLEVVHREDVASSRATFLDAVQSENNDRQNLDPIERAIAIETMVTELGGADQVAVYYGKTKGWVSQQRKLLKLVPALQDLISSGEMPVRVGRDIAGLPAEVQLLAWDEEVAKRKAAREAAERWKTDGVPRRARSEVAEAAPRFTAVNQHQTPATPAPPQTDTEGQRFTAVNQTPETARSALPAQDPAVKPAEPTPSVPAQAAVAVPPGRPEEPQPKRFPYEDSVEAFHHLVHKMPQDHLDNLTDLLVGHREKRGATTH
ncbi:ParB N-terminal domain-containing protein [Streptomyces sp. NPDC057837]|uniref:ParB/RepB/Spo0J family partition protein n=1 Tax=Streptomyces sp. NPDC057837 TaxID=3346260 RepID=UPI0036CE3036